MFFIVTSTVESKIGNLKVTSCSTLSLTLPSFSPMSSGSLFLKSPLILHSSSAMPPKRLIVDSLSVVSQSDSEGSSVLFGVKLPPSTSGIPSSRLSTTGSNTPSS